MTKLNEGLEKRAQIRTLKRTQEALSARIANASETSPEVGVWKQELANLEQRIKAMYLEMAALDQCIYVEGHGFFFAQFWLAPDLKALKGMLGIPQSGRAPHPCPHCNCKRDEIGDLLKTWDAVGTLRFLPPATILALLDIGKRGASHGSERPVWQRAHPGTHIRSSRHRAPKGDLKEDIDNPDCFKGVHIQVTKASKAAINKMEEKQGLLEANVKVGKKRQHLRDQDTVTGEQERKKSRHTTTVTQTLGKEGNPTFATITPLITPLRAPRCRQLAIFINVKVESGVIAPVRGFGVAKVGVRASGASAAGFGVPAPVRGLAPVREEIAPVRGLGVPSPLRGLRG
ncbi:hypothetical protein CYMTET_46241 [Cymbomonas tetramitiformis]|uniref:Uncharacterized protein n=1 Tax=Cymbomonas tetramitiformis TaxID=36881 RepID=A0AAE0BWK3_9CHLO|nr:hypothetical protein CYMTET_46241 [Cymbomonas tetramitiformis]